MTTSPTFRLERLLRAEPNAAHEAVVRLAQQVPYADEVIQAGAAASLPDLTDRLLGSR